ncbi:MAG: hypothetical protein IJO08_01565 [Clostridia bacterium]|nr:hypothetical protein [Clostridia bacterium]
MITNTNKNIICVKDIPSNIIEEAIFILKPNVDEESVDMRKEIAREEAEEFLGEYVFDLENLQRENKKQNKKINYKILFSAIALAVFGLIIVTKLI